MRIRVKLEPRDAWIGAYFDTDRRRTYLCLVPFLPIVIERQSTRTVETGTVDVRPVVRRGIHKGGYQADPWPPDRTMPAPRNPGPAGQAPRPRAPEIPKGRTRDGYPPGGANLRWPFSWWHRRRR